MRRKDRLGRAGEQFAAEYIDSLGWFVLERNWRCRAGELDLIALDPGPEKDVGPTLVAVEVKTRSNLDYGHPWESIDAAKLARLHALLSLWAADHSVDHRARRVDALAVIGSEPAQMQCELLRAVS